MKLFFKLIIILPAFIYQKDIFSQSKVSKLENPVTLLPVTEAVKQYSSIAESYLYGEKIDVLSIGEKITGDKTYFLKLDSTTKQIKNQLLLKEYIKIIEKTLALIGYKRVNDSTNILCMIVDFGVIDPIRSTVTTNRRIPIELINPYASQQTTNSTISTDPLTGNVNIQSKTQIPQTGIPQISRSETNQVTIYTKFLNISCLDNNNNELWFVNCNNKSENDNLIKYIKSLCFGVYKYAEKKTVPSQNISIPLFYKSYNKKRKSKNENIILLEVKKNEIEFYNFLNSIGD